MKLKEKHRDFDVTIVGGGLVGMACALTLSNLGFKINLIEHTENSHNSHPSYDDRTLVVNQASIRFWQNLGIWENLLDDITPIKQVHVSNKGHFGVVKFDASDFEIDELAFIVEAKKLGMSLYQKVIDNQSINLICPAKFLEFNNLDDSIEIKYQFESEEFTDKSTLMIAADGIQSGIRKTLNLPTEVKSYERTAIICNITPELKHNHCAYERLTKEGPTALLPFMNNRCGFVWSVKSSEADEIMSLSDSEFLKRAQTQFGYRLGRFLKVGKRSCYPLYFVKVPQQTSNRVVLMGNAAHGVSPVSAQGLNLAVRDIANLVDVMELAIEKNNDIGSVQVLEKYQQSVDTDQTQTMQYTDDLMEWFKLDEPVINKIRSLGLFSLQQSNVAKMELFKRASGYRGLTPKLLRQS